jgi:hypothetical protein
MDYKERLSLVSEGYTPDAVGLLTSLLNLHFKIGEETVRKILGPLLEAKLPFAGIARNDPKMLEKEKRAVTRMMDKLVEKGTQRPDFKDIVYFLKDALIFSGIKPTPMYVENLAKYIYDDWEDMLLYVDVPSHGKMDMDLINKMASGEEKTENTIQAIQWLGNNKSEIIDELNLPMDLNLDEVPLKQWVIRDTDGSLRIVSDDDFKRTFES